MDRSIVFNEFIYNNDELAILAKLKDELLKTDNRPEISGKDAARLLIKYDIFTDEPIEDLHLTIMSLAERYGKIRRYLDYLQKSLAQYLPSREALLQAIKLNKKQESVILYQNYCAWKESYNKLAQAELLGHNLTALQQVQKWCHGLPDNDRLTAIFSALDRHQEACIAVDNFLEKPLRTNAQDQSKKLAEAFLDSLQELKNLNYPLFYESLSQFVTRTHGEASTALTLLLSAERIYRLEKSASLPISNVSTDTDKKAEKKAAVPSSKKYIWGGVGFGLVAIIGAVIFFNISGKDTKTAVTPTKAMAVQPVAPEPKIEEKKPETAAVIEEPAPIEKKPITGKIWAASSPRVKACGAGAMTSADCPLDQQIYLNKGTKVTILKENNKGWSLVKDSTDKTWWVFSGFIEGSSELRDWLPTTIKEQQLTVFADKNLRQPGQFAIKTDSSISVKQVDDKTYQVASPTTVMGYIPADKINLF